MDGKAFLSWCGNRLVVSGGDRVSVRNGKTLREENTAEVALAGTDVRENNIITITEEGVLERWDPEEATHIEAQRVQTEETGVMLMKTATLTKQTITGVVNKCQGYKVGDTIIAYVNSANQLKFYNTRTQMATLIETFKSTVAHLEVSPDARCIAVAHTQGVSFRNLLWPAAKQMSIVGASALSIHPYSDIISVGDQSGKIHTWSYTDTRSTLKLVHWHAHAVSALSWSCDGTTLLSGGEEAVICLWNAHTWEANRITRLPGAIIAASWKDDCSKIAVACSPGSIILIDVAQRKPCAVTHEVELLRGQPCTGIAAAYSPHGQCLALLGMENVLRVYDPSSMQYISTIKTSDINKTSRINNASLPTNNVAIAAFSKNGQHLITYEVSDIVMNGKNESNLRFWNTTEVGCLGSWNPNSVVCNPHQLSQLSDLAFSSQHGNNIAYTLSYSGLVKKWRFTGETWSFANQTDLSHAIQDSSTDSKTLSVSNDGTVVAVGRGNSVVCLSSNLETLQHLTQHVTSSAIEQILIIDSHLVARTPNNLFVWNLTTTQLVYGLEFKNYSLGELPAEGNLKSQYLVSTPRGVLRFGVQNPTPVALCDSIAKSGTKTKLSDKEMKCLFITPQRTIHYVSETGQLKTLPLEACTVLLTDQVVPTVTVKTPTDKKSGSVVGGTGAGLQQLFGDFSSKLSTKSNSSSGRVTDPTTACNTLGMFYDGASHVVC